MSFNFITLCSFIDYFSGQDLAFRRDVKLRIHMRMKMKMKIRLKMKGKIKIFRDTRIRKPLYFRWNCKHSEKIPLPVIRTFHPEPTLIRSQISKSTKIPAICKIQVKKNQIKTRSFHFSEIFYYLFAESKKWNPQIKRRNPKNQHHMCLNLIETKTWLTLRTQFGNLERKKQ